MKIKIFPQKPFTLYLQNIYPQNYISNFWKVFGMEQEGNYQSYTIGVIKTFLMFKHT